MKRLTDCIGPAFYTLHNDLKHKGHTHYWCKGGRASGKSSWISLEIILGMMRNAEKNAIVYRKVGATLLDSVFASLLWAVDELGVSEYWTALKSPMQMTYKPTGQKILFRGADDPTKSKSIRFRHGYCGYLWFEELAEFSGPEDIRSIIQSAIRGGNSAAIFYSYNPPKTARSWVNEAALEPMDGRIVHESTYLQMPSEWLGDEFLAIADHLRETNPQAYAHEYLGEVTGTGGQVFDNLQLRPATPDELAAADRVYCGQDFGFAVDPDAFVKWGFDRRRMRLVLLDAYMGSHTPTETLAEFVRKSASGRVVTCDSADPRMINELRRRSVNAVGARKGPDSIEHGLRWLQELGAIIIDPDRFPQVAREFSGYEYLRDRTGNFLPAYPDKDNHSIDATRYAMETESMQRIAITKKRKDWGL